MRLQVKNFYTMNKMNHHVIKSTICSICGIKTKSEPMYRFKIATHSKIILCLSCLSNAAYEVRKQYPEKMVEYAGDPRTDKFKTSITDRAIARYHDF